MINFIFFGIFVLFALACYKGSRKSSKIPKGLRKLPYEKGLPVIGIFHQIRTPLYIHFVNLVKKHGPLFQVKMGMRDFVVFNNYDVMKKTFKEQGDNFAGRFKIQYFKELTRDVGILFQDGDKWAKQRAFILNVFRDFGVNSSRYMDIIQEECSQLLEHLEQRNEKKTDFSNFITTYIGNITSKFVLNKRFDLESKEINDIRQFILGIGKSKDIFQILSLMFPFLDNSKWFLKCITLLSSEWKVNEKMHKYYRKEIEDHLESLDFHSDGESLIDRFLIKQREMKTKSGNEDSFTDWQLIRNIIELFIAGFETVSVTLGWSLFFMSRYPEIQEKVHSEIENHIGDKPPSMNDKMHLVYTQAVMDEIHRMGSVGPLSIVHQTFEDCSVDGLFIPKKSIIFPNLYACHYDQNIWENPKEFNPARFLSQGKNGELKYAPREELIPFGMGKRQCLGESLAKMEYFTFFSSILQKFKVSFCDEISEKRYEEVMVGNDGVIRYCLIKDYIFSRRN